MTRTLRDDEGQITLPLVVFVLVMFAVALGMFGFGEASDSRGKARKSADAAALGAAAQARDSMVTLLMTNAGGAIFHGQFAPLATTSGAQVAGCASAASWARRNSSSTLTSCRYAIPARFTTTTRSEPSGERRLQGTARATADLGLPTCRLSNYTSSGYEYHEVVTCTGAQGALAKIDYIVNAGYAVFYTDPAVQWKRTFRVRLVE